MQAHVCVIGPTYVTAKCINIINHLQNACPSCKAIKNINKIDNFQGIINVMALTVFLADALTTSSIWPSVWRGKWWNFIARERTKNFVWKYSVAEPHASCVRQITIYFLKAMGLVVCSSSLRPIWAQRISKWWGRTVAPSKSRLPQTAYCLLQYIHDPGNLPVAVPVNQKPIEAIENAQRFGLSQLHHQNEVLSSFHDAHTQIRECVKVDTFEAATAQR